MDRYLINTGVILFSCAMVIHPFIGWAQRTDTIGTGSAIRGRLTSDLQRVKNQLNQLNRTVNRLQTEVSRLETDNQRQKNRIDALERLVNRLRDKVSSLESASVSANTTEDQQTAEDEQGTIPISQPRNIWVSQPDLDYTIRRTPLDREIIYITTDDTILTRLAHRYYRNASYWEAIYKVNMDKLPAPDVIPPGIQLRLPPISEIK